MNFITRRNPLPAGTLSVGLGLLLAGLCAYGFLAISSHTLGVELYSPLATFWVTLFVCGPGFFMPLEQEVGRALAARLAQGIGGKPLVMRAAVGGTALVLVLLLVIAVENDQLANRLFEGNKLIVFALAIGLIAYFAEHLVRGILSGNGRFGPYGILIGGEGIMRMAGCVFLAAIGVKNPAAFAIALALASLLAVGIALRGQKNLVLPGPAAPWGELSTALGYLLIASVLTQLLLNVGPIAVQLLATNHEKAIGKAGIFLNGLVIARIPLFLFQAIQAALLPKLSALRVQQEWDQFKHTLFRLLGVVILFGLISSAGSFVLGPWVVRFLFGVKFDLSHTDLGYLSLAATGLMLVLTLTQALISLNGYARAAMGWLVGCAGFVIVTWLGNELYSRVEYGLMTGAFTAALTMCAVLPSLLRKCVSSENKLY